MLVLCGFSRKIIILFPGSIILQKKDSKINPVIEPVNIRTT